MKVKRSRQPPRWTLLGGGEKEDAVVATLSRWQLLQKQALDRMSPNTAVSIVGSDVVVVVFVLIRSAAPSTAVAVDPPGGSDAGVAGGGGHQSPPA